ncbi:24110_t:CDS:1, partial [Dentiscutata erythropus]
ISEREFEELKREIINIQEEITERLRKATKSRNNSFKQQLKIITEEEDEMEQQNLENLIEENNQEKYNIFDPEDNNSVEGEENREQEELEDYNILSEGEENREHEEPEYNT